MSTESVSPVSIPPTFRTTYYLVASDEQAAKTQAVLDAGAEEAYRLGQPPPPSEVVVVDSPQLQAAFEADINECALLAGCEAQLGDVIDLRDASEAALPTSAVASAAGPSTYYLVDTEEEAAYAQSLIDTGNAEARTEGFRPLPSIVVMMPQFEQAASFAQDISDCSVEPGCSAHSPRVVDLREDFPGR
jgi:hypothetical protein